MLDSMNVAIGFYEELRKVEPSARISFYRGHFFAESDSIIINPVDLTGTIGLPSYSGPRRNAPPAYGDRKRFQDATYIANLKKAA